MKLEFWKIPALGVHLGFALVAITERSGDLEVKLQYLEDQALKVTIIFRNHFGFMVCGEFGMQRYIADSPALQGRGGANFFTSTESEFMELLRRGGVEEAKPLMSFVLVDSDHWLEVVTANDPEVDTSTSTPSRHLSPPRREAVR